MFPHAQSANVLRGGRGQGRGRGRGRARGRGRGLARGRGRGRTSRKASPVNLGGDRELRGAVSGRVPLNGLVGMADRSKGGNPSPASRTRDHRLPRRAQAGQRKVTFSPTSFLSWAENILPIPTT